MLAEEGTTHAQIVVAEAGLSRQHTQDPDPKAHAKTVAAELESISGEPSWTPSKRLFTHKSLMWSRT